MGLQKSGTTDKFTFYYQNKDHLGTVRETVTSTGAMKQRVNYYPFGGQLVDTLKAMIWNRDFQQYKYNGKEFDGMYGLNTYDYGARQHYPVLARWDRIDPLCEKYYGVSPYAYCANNPVKFIDPDGCEMGDYYNMSGKFIGTDGLDDQKKYIVLDNKEAKQIKNGNFTETSSAIPVPSNDVIDQMEKAVKLTEETGNEHGFRVGVNGTVTSFAVGDEKQIEDWSVPMAELSAKNEYARYDVHTHPKGSLSEYGAAAPSTDDMANCLTSGNHPCVVLGYLPMVAASSSTTIGGATEQKLVSHICYYTPNGPVANAVEFSKFSYAVRRINK